MVVAPADAVHVGEEAHELLAVRQERAPRRAAWWDGDAAPGEVRYPVGSGVCICGGRRLPGAFRGRSRRRRRLLVPPGRIVRRRGGEEEELLPAVAVAAADDELPDAAPPRDRARGTALPRRRPRGRGRRRRRRPGRPEAVAVRGRAVEARARARVRRRGGGGRRGRDGRGPRLLQLEQPAERRPRRRRRWRWGLVLQDSAEHRVERPDAAAREELVGACARRRLAAHEGELELGVRVLVAGSHVVVLRPDDRGRFLAADNRSVLHVSHVFFFAARFVRDRVCVFGVGKEREATASPLASWQRRLYRANRVAGGGDLLEGLSASRRPSALFFLLGLGVGSCPRPRVRPLHVSRDARGRRTRGSFFLPLAWGGGAAGCVPCACAESTFSWVYTRFLGNFSKGTGSVGFAEIALA